MSPRVVAGVSPAAEPRRPPPAEQTFPHLRPFMAPDVPSVIDVGYLNPVAPDVSRLRYGYTTAYGETSLEFNVPGVYGGANLLPKVNWGKFQR